VRSIVFSKDRKLASPAYVEEKPTTATGKVNCCKIQPVRRSRHLSWQGTSGCVSSGALLLLLPKCPICIVVYLTLWTGAGVAMPVATHLRPLAAALFCASALFLVIRLVAGRRGQQGA
jgi:hypothetical protein